MKHFYLLLLGATCIVALYGCTKNSVTGPQQQTVNGITKDTLSGNISGTMLAGKTYYIPDSITVLAGDTLTLQNGVTVYALNTGTTVFIQGTLISNGTKDKPNFFTVLPSKQNGINAKASWGGIVCDSPKLVEIHFTHIDYTGGPDAQGNNRQVLLFTSSADNSSKLVLDDSWAAFGADDGIKVFGGFGEIMRNTFESIGTTDGDDINLKAGWQGDVGYNVCWEPAGSTLKMETPPDYSPTYFGRPTYANVFNNTFYASGFRRLGEMGYGMLVINGAQGKFWNNLIVNCRGGFEIGTDADTAHIRYGNNLFYATVDSLKGASKAYFSDAVGKQQPDDLMQVDPQFVNLDLTGSDYVSAPTDNNNFHLKSTSPCLNHGLVDPFGASFSGPVSSAGLGNKDMGAYPSDGSGNQH